MMKIVGVVLMLVGVNVYYSDCDLRGAALIAGRGHVSKLTVWLGIAMVMVGVTVLTWGCYDHRDPFKLEHSHVVDVVVPGKTTVLASTRVQEDGWHLTILISTGDPFIDFGEDFGAETLPRSRAPLIAQVCKRWKQVGDHETQVTYVVVERLKKDGHLAIRERFFAGEGLKAVEGPAPPHYFDASDNQ
jgi:hypothetical protein